MKEFLKIEPIKFPKGQFLSIKNRTTRLIHKIESISGINDELLGSYQPERLNPETLNKERSDSLNLQVTARGSSEE